MATTTTPVSEVTYRRLALGNIQLELHQGQLREKPGMSVEHNDVVHQLLGQLYRQLDRDDYHLRGGIGRLRRSADTYYIPDLMVIPAARVRALREQPGTLDAYEDPLPLVVEIWSPSTGSYDIRGKLPVYQERGDLEIWFIHPYERTVTAWRRRPDGTYMESVHRGGTIQLAALPGVTIDLDHLFAA